MAETWIKDVEGGFRATARGKGWQVVSPERPLREEAWHALANGLAHEVGRSSASVYDSAACARRMEQLEKELAETRCGARLGLGEKGSFFCIRPLGHGNEHCAYETDNFKGQLIWDTG